MKGRCHDADQFGSPAPAAKSRWLTTANAHLRRKCWFFRGAKLVPYRTPALVNMIAALVPSVLLARRPTSAREP